MMSVNLTILTPKGRRQSVKVVLNTTIFQILEDVCKKQGLLSQEYYLKHQNKTLDRSLTVRFSNLPNNAKLELVKRSESSINSTSNESKVTICFVTVTGERVTKICDINQTLWDAVANFQEEDSTLTPVCVYTRQEIIGRENLTKSTFKSLGIIEGNALIRIMFRSPDQPATQPFIEALVLPKPNVLEPIDMTRKTQDALKTVEQSGLDYHDLIDKIPNVESLKENWDVVENEPPRDLSSPMNIDNTPIAPFMTIENVASSSSVIEDQELQIEEEKIIYLDDRGSVLFSLDDAHNDFQDTIPDDFFTVTITDLQLLIAHQKQQLQELEDRPMQTKALKEAEYLAKLKTYPKTVIRINFPDRLVLQGSFKSCDTVEILENFVKGFLEEKDLPFYLYTAPPKRVLQSAEILGKIPLIPTAVVHFGCSDSRVTFLHNEVTLKRSSFIGANKSSKRIRGVQNQNKETDGLLLGEQKAIPSDITNDSNETLSQQRAIHESKGAIPKCFHSGKRT